jgi:hypothetical protein
MFIRFFTLMFFIALPMALFADHKIIPSPDDLPEQCPEELIDALAIAASKVRDEFDDAYLKKVSERLEEAKSLGRRNLQAGLEDLLNNANQYKLLYEELEKIVRDNWQNVERRARTVARAHLGDLAFGGVSLFYWERPKVAFTQFDLNVVDSPFAEDRFGALDREIDELETILGERRALFAVDGEAYFRTLPRVRAHMLIDDALSKKKNQESKARLELLVGSSTKIDNGPVYLVINQTNSLQESTANTLAQRDNRKHTPVLVLTGSDYHTRLSSARLLEESDLIRTEVDIPGRKPAVGIWTSRFVVYGGSVDPWDFNSALTEAIKNTLMMNLSAEDSERRSPLQIEFRLEHMYGLFGTPTLLPEYNKEFDYESDEIWDEKFMDLIDQNKDEEGITNVLRELELAQYANVRSIGSWIKNLSPEERERVLRAFAIRCLDPRGGDGVEHDLVTIESYNEGENNSAQIFVRIDVRLEWYGSSLGWETLSKLEEDLPKLELILNW